LGVGEEPGLSAHHEGSDGIFRGVMPISQLCRLVSANRQSCSVFMDRLAA
jgi:hypothetical protein